MKTLRKILLGALLLLPLMGIAHYFVFPQETRCILIGFSGFHNNGNLYSREKTSTQKLIALKEIMKQAETKNRQCWLHNTQLDYKLIYCSNKQDIENFMPADAPAATYTKLGAYIVLQDEGIDENILAHELCHTILYRNIGWYKKTFKIPAWFDEGLAMQVDDRLYYSIDSLMAKKKEGLILPDVTAYKKPNDFFNCNRQTLMLRFSTAKYLVHEWLKTHSIENFLKAIRQGEDFETAYNPR